MSSDRNHVRVVSAELEIDGSFLITQRRPDAVLGMLWEFPGGRVRAGETDAEALHRCMLDRVGLDVSVHEGLMEVVHDYGSYLLTLAVYRCTLPRPQEARAAYVNAIAWVKPEEFSQYQFPGADQHTVDLLVGALD
jgi:8-oxo-dGTP diphosphatase